MNKLIFIVLILLSFWGCNSEPEEKNQEVSETDSAITTYTLEADIQEDEEADIEIIDTIRNHQLGTLKIGDNVKSVIKELNEKYIVTFDSIYDSYEDSVFFYYYLITDQNNQRLFKIYTESNKTENDNVHMIEVFSNQYITDREFKIGDKLSKLKSKYTIKLADFNYDDGLWLFPEEFEFDGAFKLDLATKGIKNFDIENPVLDSIPEQIRINGIMIY
jgi:hypothetical protein